MAVYSIIHKDNILINSVMITLMYSQGLKALMGVRTVRLIGAFKDSPPVGKTTKYNLFMRMDTSSAATALHSLTVRSMRARVARVLRPRMRVHLGPRVRRVRSGQVSGAAYGGQLLCPVWLTHALRYDTRPPLYTTLVPQDGNPFFDLPPSCPALIATAACF